jgi:hypothetical protein
MAPDDTDAVNRRTLVVGSLLSILALAACLPVETVRPDPGPPSETSAPVRLVYEVQLLGPAHRSITVEYLLPSGETKRVRVRTPWHSEALTFSSGRASLIAKGQTGVRSLQCTVDFVSLGFVSGMSATHRCHVHKEVAWARHQ